MRTASDALSKEGESVYANKLNNHIIILYATKSSYNCSDPDPTLVIDS